jgi:hypothetical protein
MSIPHQKKMRTLGGFYVGICMKRRTDHLDLFLIGVIPKKNGLRDESY